MAYKKIDQRYCPLRRTPCDYLCKWALQGQLTDSYVRCRFIIALENIVSVIKGER